jgi:predicted RNA-binding protein with PIN domain
MPEHVIIDGNNLLHAMHAHAPIPQVGRETMVQIIDHWARQGDDEVTLVFDGPVPRLGLASQMTSSRITVKFSVSVTADDVIAAMIQRAHDPAGVRVVSSDTALRHAARLRRCRHTDAVAFIDELFPKDHEPRSIVPGASEKPREVSPEEAREWIETFGLDDEEEPFDGHDAMTQ